MTPSTASLSTSQTRLQTALQALASGNAINSAADDPAGMAQSVSDSVQLSSEAQAMNNIQDGASLLDVAGGAYGQISQSVQDMRSLAVQAGDGSLNAADLQSIQAQIGQIGQGIDQIAGNTQFNGQNLLDGSFSQALQTGTQAGQTQNLALADLSTSALGLSNMDITSASGQTDALAALDAARQRIDNQQADIGALQAGLNASLANSGVRYENLAAAKSRVGDTDYAQASSTLAQADVQQQAALRALSVYHATQAASLALLPK